MPAVRGDPEWLTVGHNNPMTARKFRCVESCGECARVMQCNTPSAGQTSDRWSTLRDELPVGIVLRASAGSRNRQLQFEPHPSVDPLIVWKPYQTKTRVEQKLRGNLT